MKYLQLDDGNILISISDKVHSPDPKNKDEYLKDDKSDLVDKVRMNIMIMVFGSILHATEQFLLE